MLFYLHSLQKVNGAYASLEILQGSLNPTFYIGLDNINKELSPHNVVICWNSCKITQVRRWCKRLGCQPIIRPHFLLLLYQISIEQRQSRHQASKYRSIKSISSVLNEPEVDTAKLTSITAQTPLFSLDIINTWS